MSVHRKTVGSIPKWGHTKDHMKMILPPSSLVLSIHRTEKGKGVNSSQTVRPGGKGSLSGCTRPKIRHIMWHLIRSKSTVLSGPQLDQNSPTRKLGKRGMNDQASSIKLERGSSDRNDSTVNLNLNLNIKR